MTHAQDSPLPGRKLNKQGDSTTSTWKMEGLYGAGLHKQQLDSTPGLRFPKQAVSGFRRPRAEQEIPYVTSGDDIADSQEVQSRMFVIVEFSERES